MLAMAEKDFLDQLLEMITKRLDGVESKIGENTALTQKAFNEVRKTSDRLVSAENAIKTLESHRGKRVNISPNLAYLIALSSLILLVIIASILHVDIGGLVK